MESRQQRQARLAIEAARQAWTGLGIVVQLDEHNDGIQYVYTINRLLRIQIVLCSYGIVRCVLGTPTRGYAAH